mmetsp:Transcript_33971/g.108410  ORF Transcript_33971/g.108410 Transcript_33971/m.108410 type:complete len:177 (-) Transcript_33971:363-893(-)
MGLIDIAATKAGNEWLFCAAPSCCSSGGCASTIRSTAHNNGIIIGIQLGEQDANEYCCISLRCCLGAKYTPSGVDQLPLFPTSLSGPADDLLCQVSTPCVQVGLRNEIRSEHLCAANSNLCCIHMMVDLPEAGSDVPGHLCAVAGLRLDPKPVMLASPYPPEAQSILRSSSRPFAS